MDKEVIKDIFEWDVVNWSRALDFWKAHASTGRHPLQCLELGGRRGGLSLWAALEGHRVICSDLEDPKEHAIGLHSRYKVTDLITYEAIDATAIPYEDEFDQVMFKSVLGGIGREGNDASIRKTIKEIHRALRPGGQLFYAENLAASIVHRSLRKRFVNWGGQWNYLAASAVDDLFKDFSIHTHRSTGFLGAFGRSEWQRSAAGRVDALIDPLLPGSWQYIVIGVATK